MYLGTHARTERHRHEAEARDERRHQYRSQPGNRRFFDRLFQAATALLQLANVADENHIVEDGHAGKRDEADARRDRKRHVAQPQCEDAADPRERHASEHADGVQDVTVRRVKEQENEHQRDRYDDHQPQSRPDELLELPAVIDVIPTGR